MSYIDTRELYEELCELQQAEANDASLLDDEDRERLAALEELESEIGSEFQYGAAMIPEDEFEDYAQQFAEEIGAIPEDNAWPLYCIDWERAADELRVDYSSVEWEGTTYLVRL